MGRPLVFCSPPRSRVCRPALPPCARRGSGARVRRAHAHNDASGGGTHQGEPGVQRREASCIRCARRVRQHRRLLTRPKGVCRRPSCVRACDAHRKRAHAVAGAGASPTRTDVPPVCPPTCSPTAQQASANASARIRIVTRRNVKTFRPAVASPGSARTDP
jgi:hypothetical protein